MKLVFIMFILISLYMTKSLIERHELESILDSRFAKEEQSRKDDIITIITEVENLLIWNNRSIISYKTEPLLATSVLLKLYEANYYAEYRIPENNIIIDTMKDIGFEICIVNYKPIEIKVSDDFVYTDHRARKHCLPSFIAVNHPRLLQMMILEPSFIE